MSGFSEPFTQSTQNARSDEPSTQNSQNEIPKAKGKCKDYSKRLVIWNHFTEFVDTEGKKKCKCNYCSREYSCASIICGTSMLMHHMKSCSSNPANQNDSQAQLQVNSIKVEETRETKVSLQSWRFDQQVGRKEIAKMIIMDELPFKFVENPGFRYCMKINQTALILPSRSTVTRDCYQVYLDEKSKLKAQLKHSTLRMCLITDTWTSLQCINYICLTAHYIDNNWNLQKKVLNFCPITSHIGSDIGRNVELCLIDWGIQNILTVIVDNTSSNNTGIDYLRNKFVKWGNLCVLNGKWIHVRCIAHVLNIVVQDGIKELRGSVTSVRVAIRYVRQSPGSVRKFKGMAKLEKVECEKSLCLDVPTRWNSTYMMLSIAVMYEHAFDRLAIEDFQYKHELTLGPGVPLAFDWENVWRLVCFLGHFYDHTLRVSGTKYITSNTYLDSISTIHSVLKDCFASCDEQLRVMAIAMKKKFDKYWGDIEKFNLLVFIAAMFDPRTKFDYVELILCGMYGDTDGQKIAALCKSTLYELFNKYKRIHSDKHTRKESSSSQPSSQSSSCRSSLSNESSMFGKNEYEAQREKMMDLLKRRKAGSGVANDAKSELDMHLTEESKEDAAYFITKDFSVLDWWKWRCGAFPVLSLVARDVLAIPISTVASESTFRTEGRVLGSFRSSLTPRTVQSLICCRDWIRSNDVPVNVEEYIEDHEKFEADIAQTESTIVDVKA